MQKIKTLSLTAIFCGLTLVSFSKDKKTDTIVKVTEVPTLTGNWQYYKEGIITNNVESLSEYDHTEGCGKDFYNFKADNTGEVTNYSLNCIQDVTAFNYVNNGATITITNSAETYVYKIISLTSNELKINEAGTNIIIVFKKV